MTGIAKRYPGVQALDGVVVRSARWRDPRAARRERRRQVDAAQDPLRRRDAGRRAGSRSTARRARSAEPQDAQALRASPRSIRSSTCCPISSVAENVFIGREPGGRLFVSWRRPRRSGRARCSQRIGLDDRPARAGPRPLGRRAADGRDRARAVDGRATDHHGRAHLGAVRDRGRRPLFAIVRDLRPQGLGIIFVTHRLDEVMRICDRATVLRDGRLVGTRAVAEGLSVDELIRMMVGRPVGQLFAPLGPREPGAVVLEVGGPQPAGQPPRSACERARRGKLLECAGARSSASQG